MLAIMQELMAIGAFARLTRLTIKALRLYESKGLLRPAYVDPGSRYRYYRFDQAERAAQIRQLRLADVPLQEIGRILDGGPSAAQTALASHRQRLSQEVQGHLEALTQLDHFSVADSTAPDYAIETCTVPERRVLRLQDVAPLNRLGEVLPRLFGELYGWLGGAGVVSSGPAMCIQRDRDAHGSWSDDVDAEAIPIEICAPIARAATVPEADRITVVTLPGGTALGTVHSGSYHTIGRAYQALAMALDAGDYTVEQPPWELYLVSPYHTGDPDAYRTRIEWLVQP